MISKNRLEIRKRRMSRNKVNLSSSNDIFQGSVFTDVFVWLLFICGIVMVWRAYEELPGPASNALTMLALTITILGGGGKQSSKRILMIISAIVSISWGCYITSHNKIDVTINMRAFGFNETDCNHSLLSMCIAQVHEESKADVFKCIDQVEEKNFAPYPDLFYKARLTPSSPLAPIIYVDMTLINRTYKEDAIVSIYMLLKNQKTPGTSILYHGKRTLDEKASLPLSASLDNRILNQFRRIMLPPRKSRSEVIEFQLLPMKDMQTTRQGTILPGDFDMELILRYEKIGVIGYALPRVSFSLFDMYSSLATCKIREEKILPNFIKKIIPDFQPYEAPYELEN